jgi:hypothetical protein
VNVRNNLALDSFWVASCEARVRAQVVCVRRVYLLLY